MLDSKDLILLVLGGVVGVIAAVLIQDHLNEMRRLGTAKFRNLCLRIMGSDTSDLFSVRGHKTSIHIIDGDGRLSYSPETVNFRFVDPPILPSDITEIIKQVAEREDAKKRNGVEPHWNGAQLGLASLDIGRSRDETLLTLSADVFRSDYFTFLSTCGTILEERECGKTDLYDRHLRRAAIGELVPYMTSGLGVVVTVITSDRKLVAARRARKSGVRKYQLDLCIAESVNPDTDVNEANMFDPWNTACRGVFEELAVLPERRSIKLLGLAVDTQCHQFNFLAMCSLDMTSLELYRQRARGGAGKWEIQDLQVFSFDDADLNEALSNSSDWGFNKLSMYWAAKNLLPGSAIKRLFH